MPSSAPRSHIFDDRALVQVVNDSLRGGARANSNEHQHGSISEQGFDDSELEMVESFVPRDSNTAHLFVNLIDIIED